MDGRLTLKYGDTAMLAERCLADPRVGGLLSLVEEHDPVTAHHLIRTAHAAADMGRQFGLKPDRLELLAIGGGVHDVGKTGISPDILNKPGPDGLTPEEQAIMATHVQKSLDMIREAGLGDMPGLLEIVGRHHDYAGLFPQDGSGRVLPAYTRSARILMTAEMFDALRNPRPYREAEMSPEEIRAGMAKRGIYPEYIALALELF